VRNICRTSPGAPLQGKEADDNAENQSHTAADEQTHSGPGRRDPYVAEKVLMEEEEDELVPCCSRCRQIGGGDGAGTGEGPPQAEDARWEAASAGPATRAWVLRRGAFTMAGPGRPPWRCGRNVAWGQRRIRRRGADLIRHVGYVGQRGLPSL